MTCLLALYVTDKGTTLEISSQERHMQVRFKDAPAAVAAAAAAPFLNARQLTGIWLPTGRRPGVSWRGTSWDSELCAEQAPAKQTATVLKYLETWLLD